MLVWLQFIVCLAVIVVAGSKLARYGDLIAEKTGLGRVWLGVVVLAAITSLPELATGISSVAIIGRPNLTMGDLFGSNLINLMIIVLIDLLHRTGPVLHYIGTGIVLSTVMSLFMIAAAAASLYLAQNLLTVAIFGRVGIYSIVLLLLYLLAQYMIFRFTSAEESRENHEVLAVPAGYLAVSLRRAINYFALAAVATVGAGIWLAFIGDQISDATGLSASFVGTLFLAVSTSAPEIVVSVSAAKLGAQEMAVGNMVGSNLFNMGVIIFVADLFAPGTILQGVSGDHIVTALFGVMMSGIVIIGIVFKPRRWLPKWVSADIAALGILYVGAMVTLYLLGRMG